jgi:hypothetical protein
MSLKVGDDVTLLYVSDNGLVFRKKSDGKMFVAYPYCSCNSGFWWLTIEAVSQEKISQFSDTIQHIVEQALKHNHK